VSSASQYWDGEQKLSVEIAHALGVDGWKAWDVYLYFPPGARWDDHLPAPLAAVAQTEGVVVATKGLLPPAGDQAELANRWRDRADVIGSQDDITALLAHATDAFSRQCGCAMTTSSPSVPPPGATSK
jgi:hypothetical protein